MTQEKPVLSGDGGPHEELNREAAERLARLDFLTLQGFINPTQFYAGWLVAVGRPVACYGPTPLTALDAAVMGAREAQ